jgi:hypothetical protein
MQGFDSKFKDFPDYILKITKEIWEERKLATLHHYYSPDIIVRSPSSIVQGNQSVIAATMATLSEFPDRRLLGEDVIFSGSPEQGMLSSHRILSTATHAGNGVYGKATNKVLRYRVIADCYAINNQISDEWLIRDQGAIVRQLGYQHSIDYVRELIEREGGFEKAARPFTPKDDIIGPYQGTGNDHPVGQQLSDILQRIMNADFSVIPDNYDRAANLFYAGGIETFSHDGADKFWMGLRASFPSAQFKIHHTIGRQQDNMPPSAAVRWSLTGKHDGWGSFGTPSNADVHIMGITHAEFGQWGLRREYTIFDEPAIYKQILLKKGE